MGNLLANKWGALSGGSPCEHSSYDPPAFLREAFCVSAFSQYSNVFFAAATIRFTLGM